MADLPDRETGTNEVIGVRFDGGNTVRRVLGEGGRH
jgi:hypothetical protein